MGILIGRKQNRAKREAGFILIPTLILLVIGSTIIAGLCSYMITGLKSDTLYMSKTDALYAADAGIEDAFWQIKYDNIKTFHNPVNYSPYDYNTAWVYNVSEQLNRQDVAVSIKNVWIPQNIPVPLDPAYASNLITTGKLIVTGSVSGSLTYKIKITYYPDVTDNPLQIQTLGIWLPPGYTYVEGSSNLESDHLKPYYPSSVDVLPHSGGQAIIWHFTPGTLFAGSEGPPVVAPFPEVDSSAIPLTSTVTFGFTSQQAGGTPNAVTWVTTAGVSDIPFTWDADTQIFHINSTAGATQAEAYTSKNELRQLQSSIAGDYYATGQSLMQDTNNNPKYRELLLTSSSNNISAIPSDAVVQSAYLYWSGYVHDKANGIWWDQCGFLTGPNNKWNQTGTWVVDSNMATDNSYYDRFKGQNNGSSLTMKNSIDLSGLTGGATISWNQNGNTTPVFSDPGTSPISTYWNTSSPTDWSYNSGAYRARYHSGYDATLTHSQDLGYIPSASTTTISWTWWSDSSLGSGNGLNVEISSDGVNFTHIDGFTNTKSSPQTRTYTLSNTYFTSTFKMRFILVGSNSTKYCYVNNINITANPNPNTLHLKISKDNGSTWLDTFESGNFPSNPSVPIPAGYLTSQFKMAFYLNGFTHSADYATIDNVLITDDSITSHYDPNISFTLKKDTETVGHTETISALSHSGDFAWPGIGDNTSSKVLSGGVTFDGYYYACKSDVTDLVKSYSDGADLNANPNVYGNGNATYTVGDVYSDTESVMNAGKLADSGYAGWSLVIIYTSPDTKGHSLYIYDYCESANYTRSVPNQNADGSAYVISMPVGGFIVPNKISGETDANDAAKITIFVGEGDIQLTSDHVDFTGQNMVTERLWDGVTNDSNDTQSNPNNVWNSEWIDQSTGNICSIPGIDVDTFHIKWGDNVGGVRLINTGDTSGTLNLTTHGDGYVLIYTILSFRSEATTGGSLSYLIKN